MKKVALLSGMLVLVSGFTKIENNQLDNAFFAASEVCNSENGGHYELEIGKSYPILKIEDKEINISINNNTAIFHSSCGTTAEFLPFFTKDSADKITPPEPELNDFDKAVLQTCGAWGKDITKDAVIELMKNNPQILEDIYNSADKSLHKNQEQSIEEFVDSFAESWVNQGGFKHVLCGNPTIKRKKSENKASIKLGGLHFVGRYADPQLRGYIGINKTSEVDEIDRSNYIMPMKYVAANGTISNKDKNGYLYTAHAQDILLHATKVYKYISNPNDKNPKAQYACIYDFKDSKGDIYNMTFVMRKDTENSNNHSGIVTFFPGIVAEMHNSPCNIPDEEIVQ